MATRVAEYIASLELRSKGANNELKNFNKEANRVADNAAGRFGVVGSSLRANLAAGIAVGGGVGLFKLAQLSAEVEQAQVSVQKTTGLTDAEVNKLTASLARLSTEIPVTTMELLDLATVGGQFGISNLQDLEAFTKAFAQLQIASDGTLAGQLDAQNLAKFIELTGDSISNIQNIGSAITSLGNTAKLTEGQLLPVALEVSKVSQQFGLSSRAVLGIASSLKEIGVEAELAGTFALKFFSQLEEAVTTGNKIEEFTKLTGLTRKELKELFEDNPELALVEFSRGLNRVVSEGGSAIQTLDNLGFKESRIQKGLAGLAGTYETLATRIKTANDEYERGLSLTEEVEQASDTLLSDLSELGNSFNRLFISLTGSGINEPLKELVNDAKELVNAITDAIEKTREFFDLITSPLEGTFVGELLDNIGDAFGSGRAGTAKSLARASANPLQAVTDGVSRGIARSLVDRFDITGQDLTDIVPLLRGARFLGDVTGINDRFSSAPTTASQTQTTTVNNDITVNAPNAEQAANDISRITQADIADAQGT